MSGCINRSTIVAWALYYYRFCDTSQEFQPMASQLSKKAALPLAKILATCRNNVSNTGPRALSYYSDLTLSQEFQPMAAQLSMKAALPLAKILATASCRSSKTGSSIVKGTVTHWRLFQASPAVNILQVIRTILKNVNVIFAIKSKQNEEGQISSIRRR